MNIRMLLLAICLCFVLTGCEWTPVSIDTLLTPPTLMEGQDELDAALLEAVEVSKTISLVYPTTGELRTPYILCNLDEESGEEAVVFYRLTDSAGVTGALMITVLDDVDGQWEAVWTSSELPANEVYDVTVIEEDGASLLVLGLTLFSSDNGNSQQVLVYQYQDNQLTQLMSQECAAHTVYDLDEDGMVDLFTIVKNVVAETEDATTTATRYIWADNSFIAKQTVALDPQVTSYTITTGYAENGINALFVDGVKGSEQITELLTLSNGNLINLLEGVDTLRPVELYCLDFDNDGYIEIPMTLPITGEDQTLYRVLYYAVTNWGLEVKLDTYSDFNSGYYFAWPEQFGYQVSLVQSSDGTAVTFYYDSNDQALFTIKVFDYSQLETQKLPTGYTELARDGQLVYGLYLYDSDVSIQLTVEEVLDAFALF